MKLILKTVNLKGHPRDFALYVLRERGGRKFNHDQD